MRVEDDGHLRPGHHAENGQPLNQPVARGLQRGPAEQTLELWPRVNHVVAVDDHPLRHRLPKSHERLAVADQGLVDAREARDLKDEPEERVAERRNKPQRRENRDDAELSVLIRKTLGRIWKPRPKDAESVEPRHREQVQDQRDGFDESKERQGAEEVDVGNDPVLVARDKKRNRHEHSAQQRARRPGD